LFFARKPWQCGQSWGWITGILNATVCGEEPIPLLRRLRYMGNTHGMVSNDINLP